MDEAALESFVSWLGVVAQALAILIAGAGFVGAVVGWSLWKSTEALDKLKDEKIRQAEEQLQLEIKTAGARIEEARRGVAEAAARASEANEKALQLDKEAAEVRLEQEKLRRSNLTLERILFPRQFVGEGEEFEKLRKFAGTPLWIVAPALRDEDDASPMLKVQEAQDFAVSFNRLSWVDWQPRFVGDFEPSHPRHVRDGLHIYSRRPGEDRPELYLDSPYKLEIDSPEQKAWAAAEALTKYLRSEMDMDSAQHWPIAIVDGKPDDPQFNDLPPNGILVEVGKRDRDLDLLFLSVRKSFESSK